MREILTITLNPALDVSASVPHVTAGAKLRCGPERYDPGGGGLNVARAIRFLGGDVRAFVAGDRHHLALAIPLDDHYMGGLVDKYFGRRPPLTYWALRTDAD